MNRILLGLLITILSLLNHISSHSQTVYNNEWIDYSKTYIKIPVASTGIFRLWYDDIAKFGAPIDGAEKSTIKLYHRGKEQTLADYPGSSSFTSYMEFYGEKNDGTLDSVLYGSEKQTNKFYNLFSDTSYYFLTWGGTEGKRMPKISANISGNQAKYHNKDTIKVYTENYAMGLAYDDKTHESSYNTAEGWCSSSLSGETVFKFYLKKLHENSDNLKIDFNILSLNGISNTTTVSIGKSLNNLKQLGTFNIDAFSSYLASYQLDDNLNLGDSIYISINGYPSNSRYSLAFIKISYQQKLNSFHDNLINIPANTFDYLVIPNQVSLLNIYDISDLNNVKQVNYSQTDSIRFGFTNNNKNFTFFLNSKDPIDNLKLEKAIFKNYTTTSNTFTIIYHPSLTTKTTQYQNPIKAYSDYRASIKGGANDTLTVSIIDIYNQFSYGEKSPLAIQNFCKWISRDTLTMPSNLFLIGKAYEYGYSNAENIRNGINKSKTDIDLIPTYGTPGSDVKFSSGIYPNKPYLQAIPTGRYTAINAQEVSDYLNKIKEHESLSYNELWRKNMIHLSGGKEATQIAHFRNIMDGLKTIVEGKYKGAHVKTFSKSTTDIQLFNLSDDVNKGVSAITFFGHSSPTTNDIDIGYITDPFLGYDNKGKYPIIILHGCKAGNPFTQSSFGENWIKTPNKGSIAMMGNSDYAYEDLLYHYSSVFYNTAYNDSIFFNAGIGKIIKEVGKRFSPVNPRDITQLDQMILQGDPSLIFFGPQKADYYTNNDQIFLKSLDGKPVTAVSDSFAVGIVISNLGKVDQQEIYISVERTVDGIKKQLPIIKTPQIPYKDTIYYVLYSRDLATAGQNSIKVKLNFNSSISELNTNNNIGILNFYIPRSGLTCLIPKEFSIINSSNISLVAQATDILSDNRDYLFEIDTSYYFNSPLYQTKTINAGPLAIWKDVNLLNKLNPNADSVVFFWKIRYKNLLPGEQLISVNSSFIYIKNGTNGWSQTVFEQFNKDELIDGLTKDTIKKTWSFIPKTQKINVVTQGINAGSTSDVVVKINDYPVVSLGNCNPNFGGDGIYAIAFDKKTLKPYTFFDEPIFREFPILKCFYQPVNRFAHLNPEYSQWPDYKSYFKQFVDSVKTDDYVLLVSAGNTNIETWGSGNNQPPYNKFLDKKVEQLGCQKLPYLKNGHPYIFLGHKGFAPISEMIPDSLSIVDPLYQTLILDTVLKSTEPEASLLTTVIGPTTKWGSFNHRFAHLESNSKDKWSVDIIGINLNGDETTILKDTILPSGFDLSSIIDANKYPKLKLKVTLQDFDKFTPAQFKMLQVTFDPVPEGSVVFENGDKYKNIGTKQEGDSIVLNYSFQNIYSKEFKSPLLINYRLLNNSKEIFNYNDTINTVLQPDSLLKISKTIKTLDLIGDNVFQVFVNPNNQPEQLFDNNRWVMPYSVSRDRLNPLLDVFFDGTRIMNGDIVSSNPEIQIVLKDENKFLLKKDTIGLSIFIKKCELCDFERISFSSPEININYPSSTNNNKVSITYSPKNLPEGRYSLRVQGTDASNNISGLQPYLISFEVSNKSSVSYFYPYPNPFSTSTKFAYTLSGSIIPDEVKIQILTATGKVVKEITQDELGHLKSGTHLTDFSWNGTDEFGDKLANGVYLYRVILKANGNEINHYQTTADKAFKNDWGKLYILR